MPQRVQSSSVNTAYPVLVSSILISSNPKVVWQNITNVDLAQYRAPRIFKILGVPRPLHAELRGNGVGAERTAWFDNGKSFNQIVKEWNEPTVLRFSFSADPGFIVGYFFDLSCGKFQIIEGWYQLVQLPNQESKLSLGTKYLCAFPSWSLIPFAIRSVLRTYQKFLLSRIRANCEVAGEN